MIANTLMLTIVLAQNQYWTVDYLTQPSGEVLEVGGIGFLPDGDMVVSTRRGQVWRIDNPQAENPSDATFTLICEGLHEGLGIAVFESEIFVMQRGEVSKLVDLDNDMLRTIDNDDVIDNSAGFDNSEVGANATQGLTPMHRQNVDEATVENVLVQDNLDDDTYPSIVDIADKEAAERSNDDDF